MNTTEAPVFIVSVLVGSILIPGILVVAIVAFVMSTYRRVARRKLYIPVVAKVVHVIHDESFFGDSSTAFVTYEIQGCQIAHRLCVPKHVGWHADRSQQVNLLVDPKYPKHAEVDEAYKQLAKSTPAPPPPSVIRRCLASASVVLGPFAQLDAFSHGPTRVFFLVLGLVLIAAGILQACLGRHLSPDGVVASNPLSLDTWLRSAPWIVPGAIGVIMFQFSQNLPRSVVIEWQRVSRKTSISPYRWVLGGLAGLALLLIIIGLSARTAQRFAANAKAVAAPIPNPYAQSSDDASDSIGRLSEEEAVRRLKLIQENLDRPNPEFKRLLQE